jgi:hypothetical protein
MGFRANIAFFDPPPIKGALPEGLLYVGGRYGERCIVSNFEMKAGWYINVLNELHEKMDFANRQDVKYRAVILWECGGVVVADFGKDGITYGEFDEKPLRTTVPTGRHCYCYGCSEIEEI